MCSRYYVEMSPELRPIVERAAKSSLARQMVHDLGRPVRTEGEVRPTDIAAVIASDRKGSPSVFPMIWGFSAPDRENTKRSQPLINARSETASQKPTFRECWLRRRCIIPCSYYFEWEHLKKTDGTSKTGSKYIIQPEGTTVTYLAGLYRMEGNFPHFTVLTREPSPELSKLHDRMPVILPQDLIREWIRPEAFPDGIIGHALADMIFEKV